MAEAARPRGVPAHQRKPTIHTHNQTPIAARHQEQFGVQYLAQGYVDIKLLVSR